MMPDTNKARAASENIFRLLDRKVKKKEFKFKFKF